MVFSYLNHKDVWPKYCAVHEAIYDHMGDFDTWYSAQTGAAVTIPNLQKEWKEYNRVVLDSMVRRARETAGYMYKNKRIQNTCKNMDKSTV
ncbi:bacteriodes thetaiotaomicron symbiotic [Fusarium beomiforme]|uniref:Bacteriodes thetaiotaomicron symbiotic n=1 Tax=Fusarium beomiforme TaxID=44412 RepID=A0A9P5A3N3_9HYPO|nr:bacteriodes thetaiotaomicron symbiotic [Fusarium beomiforme]